MHACPASRLALPLTLALLPACGDSGGDTSPDTSSSSSTAATSSGSSTAPTSSTGSTSGDPTGSSSSSGEAPTSTTVEATTGTSTTDATTTSDTTDAATSSTGEPVGPWIARFGAPEDLRATGLGFGPEGELWVAGDFLGALDLGAGPLKGVGTGIFLGKFAADGTPLHSEALFSASDVPTFTQVTGLAVDSTGAVIVTGWLEGSYTIGGAQLVADELDVFVGKWDADGAPLWGRKFGAVDWQVGEALAVAADDTIWVAGATLAPFNVDDFELTGAASTGMFAVRLAADGKALAGAWWGDEGDQEIRSIAACPDGSAAIAGFFDAPLKFAGDTVEPVGDKDIFVGRIDAAAGPLWISAYGSAGSDNATEVVCGDAITFAGSVTDAVQFGELMLEPAGDNDVVLARLDLDGALTWATAITGFDDQLPTGLVALPDGGVAVTLRTYDVAKLGDETHTSAGQSDILYARYAAAATTPAQVIGLGDVGADGAGPLALGPDAAVALTGTISGTATWPGLRPVTAVGPTDLVLVRFSAAE